MQRLSEMDSNFLQQESARTPMHISPVIVYDPSARPGGGKVRFKEILTVFERNLHKSAIFRRKLVGGAMGLDTPYWVEDADFDLEFHVRHLALPKPGDWRQFCILLARLQARGLDMKRPLWEAYVIEGLNRVEGLPENSFAIMLKIHHSAIDGISGAEIVTAIHSLTDEIEPPLIEDNWQGENEPTAWEIWSRAYFHNLRLPIKFMETVSALVPAIVRARKLSANPQIDRRKTLTAKTRFNQRISNNRVTDTLIMELAEVKFIRKAFGNVSINDVVVAIIGGALRKYLLSKGELPESSLIAGAPINMRSERNSDASGNQVSLMRITMATDIADPVQQLEAIHESAQQSKVFSNALGASVMMNISEILIPQVLGWGFRAVTLAAARTARPMPCHVVISNVPGPQFPLYLAGARMHLVMGMGPLLDMMGLFHAVLSGAGHITINFLSCREMIPDPQFYKACLQEAYDNLRTAAQRAASAKAPKSKATGKTKDKKKKVRPNRKKLLKERSAEKNHGAERIVTRPTLACVAPFLFTKTKSYEVPIALKYRADIDSLRAIAVLSVVLFHLGVPGFQGGYVGVDVFFVISGYLITSIIKHKHELHDFRLPDFYGRRIRRLVPPLIATVAATMTGAALVMTPFDMKAFSRSAAAALFSLSNIVFYLEAGYWDTASELKPLLHTWSLGVEEQFYLFWPALIIALLRLRRFVAFGTSLAVISILGAALCIWFTGIDQSAAFYLLPFRVFQFAVGALLIPLTVSRQGSTKRFSSMSPTIAFWSGLICIVISVIALGEKTIFPGWAVMLPTIGAALVLLSGALPAQPNVPVRALMQNPLSIWLGRVSYSMYLVHWPLIVLFRYRYGVELTFTDQLILAMSTLLATCALHYGIERRFYQRVEGRADKPIVPSSGRFALRTLAVAGLLAMIAASAWLGDGWGWRYPSLSLSAEQIDKGERDRFRKLQNACQLKDAQSISHCDFAAKTQILVLGDSTVVDTFHFIDGGFGNDKSLNVILFGNVINQCKRLREESGRFITKDETCQNQLTALFDPSMVARLDIVIYSVYIPYGKSNAKLLSLLQRLKSLNPKIQILTMGGYINTRRPCAYYINKTNTTDACALPENVEYFEADPSSEPLFSQFRAIESYYIDRVGLLCKNRVLQTCRTRTDQGIPVLYDTIHNSMEFAEMTGKMYAKKYPGLLHDFAQ